MPPLNSRILLWWSETGSVKSKALGKLNYFFQLQYLQLQPRRLRMAQPPVESAVKDVTPKPKAVVLENPALRMLGMFSLGIPAYS